ncbi:MAG: hypothetical protein Kow001_13850 [Acidobacteriota bacterium]
MKILFSGVSSFAAKFQNIPVSLVPLNVMSPWPIESILGYSALEGKGSASQGDTNSKNDSPSECNLTKQWDGRPSEA